MVRNVLALNSGSSSVKFGVYVIGPTTLKRIWSGETVSTASTTAPFAPLRQFLAQSDTELHAIGHRIVHGGPFHTAPCLIDAAVLTQIKDAAAFAPLHAAPSLALIDEAAAEFPELAQVACFDTAFHAELPPEARTLPIARELQRTGLHRYGFHGLSCESIVRQLGTPLPSRLIIAHLGNGCSVTAVHEGRSVDTSMGFTPTGGVLMGTRSGDLDPGLLVYLMREMQYDANAIEALVDHKSGLAGVSGVGSDMRSLHAAVGNPDAALAVAMFCASVRKEIAAMASVLHGVDLLVFTGGIGENDEAVRAATCHDMAWMGVSEDKIRVLPSREEEEIVRHVWAILS